jgi:hypothetical protein
MVYDAKIVSGAIEPHSDLGMFGPHGRSLSHVSVAGVAAMVVAPLDMVFGKRHLGIPDRRQPNRANQRNSEQPHKGYWRTGHSQFGSGSVTL